MLNGNRVIAIRARARRGWSIKRITSFFGVSRNTVRRYTRQGPPSCGSRKNASLDVQQELELVRRIARKWESRDPEELESALTLKLAKIYPKKSDATNWTAVLVTALNRAAINWLRGCNRREKHVAASNARSLQDGELDASADAAPFVDIGFDETPLIQRLRPALSPFLRRVWDALIAENFNQTQAAIRLGVHRNTIRNAVRKIYRIYLVLKRRES